MLRAPNATFKAPRFETLAYSTHRDFPFDRLHGLVRVMVHRPDRTSVDGLTWYGVEFPSECGCTPCVHSLAGEQSAAIRRHCFGTEARATTGHFASADPQPSVRRDSRRCFQNGPTQVTEQKGSFKFVCRSLETPNNIEQG